MTTGLIPGEQPPDDPRPTDGLPHQRHEPAGQGAMPVENRSRSSVITARAAASFEPVGRSVASARSFVRDTLQGWGFGDIVDDAVVLTSELVTNAVVHAGTSADLLCLRSEDGVRIEVADRYPEREVPLQGFPVDMGNPDREGGRGLQLCAALAGHWGVDYTPTHKTVWFQLALPERPVGTRAAGPALP
ncbi:ATP-binding protein, partial [Streptomyces sp. Z38]